MPKVRFEGIYRDLRGKIEDGRYPYQSFLPSEHELAGLYSCSRNTVRRSLGRLACEGYVLPLHGKGVRVIWRSLPHDDIGSLDRLQPFREYAAENHKEPGTSLELFERVACDRRLAELTGFTEGAAVFRVKRIHTLDGVPCQIVMTCLLASAVPGLTPDIARDSLYSYIERGLGLRILTSKRQITVELASDDDRRHLRLDPYNCVAVVESEVFNSEGLMFGLTQIRTHPDSFRYCTISHR